MKEYGILIALSGCVTTIYTMQLSHQSADTLITISIIEDISIRHPTADAIAKVYDTQGTKCIFPGGHCSALARKKHCIALDIEWSEVARHLRVQDKWVLGFSDESVIQELRTDFLRQIAAHILGVTGSPFSNIPNCQAATSSDLAGSPLTHAVLIRTVVPIFTRAATVYAPIPPARAATPAPLQPFNPRQSQLMLSITPLADPMHDALACYAMPAYGKILSQRDLSIQPFKKDARDK